MAGGNAFGRWSCSFNVLLSGLDITGVDVGGGLVVPSSTASILNRER